MAKRKSGYKRIKKIEPAVQTMAFSVNVPYATTQSYFIDLSQCASLLNRRFYRQGINWAVSGLKFLSQPGTTGNPLNGVISVEKLPETWVMSNAWEKGFRVWQRMNNEALAESESVRPRFLDFKVYADSEHHTAGYGANLLPITAAGLATVGEWESSKLRIPDTTLLGNTREREMIATGASYPGTGASGLNAVSLIEGYAASRSLPNILADPNVPDDASDIAGPTPENWMSAIFNEGTTQDADIVGELTTENNQAPYPYGNDGIHTDTMYPGGANQLQGLQIHSIETVTGTTIGGVTRVKGGNFPCGLISIDAVNQGDAAGIIVQIDLVPGNHRGYLCEPMTEM